jgi:hypothetical protein
MLPRITVRPPRPEAERRRAVELYRQWDAAMIRRYGPLYHRKKGYTVH